MAIRQNYKGMKFNHLTLINYERPGGQGVGAIWSAQCDCGNLRSVTAKRVVHGQIKSCGKCQYSRDLARAGRSETSSLRATERRLFMRYLTKSSQKGLGWDLTPEQFKQIVTSACHYCGRKPSDGMRGTKAKYSGIDRVDGTGKYTSKNCVPACSNCRSLKGDLNQLQFEDIVVNLAVHIIERRRKVNT